MYIVLDTNVWRKEWGLKSRLGSAIRFFIKHQSATLAIPEVIKLETEALINKELKKKIETIEKEHRELLTVFGQLKEIKTPTNEEVGEIISKIFVDLGVPTEFIPFTFEASKNSFDKILAKVAPNRGKNQQFKDGVIWFDCMNLLDKADVHFVTNDKGFFNDGNFGSGLAKNLQEEVTKKENNFYIHDKLSSLLNDIEAKIKIDPPKILLEYKKEFGGAIQDMISEFGFGLGSIKSSTINTFITENPDVLYFEYVLEIECFPLENDGSSDGLLIIEGNGGYNPSENSFIEFKRSGQVFSYVTPTGAKEKKQHYTLSVNSSVIGHRTIKHSIRHEI